MSQATINISGIVNMPIVVNLTDTISSVLDQINIQNLSDSKSELTLSNSKVLFNNTPMSPALSLMFYGVHDGSELTVIRKATDNFNHLQLNDRMTSSTNNIFQYQCGIGRNKSGLRNRRPNLSRFPGTDLLQGQEISKSFDCFPQIRSVRSSSNDLTLGEIGKQCNNDDEQGNQAPIYFSDPSYHSISNSDGNFVHKINNYPSNSILTPSINNNQNSRSTNNFNLKMQSFMEKCSNNMRDPEFVFQRFQDSINPETAFEAARITDIYRSRIESNPLSFRKFCKKYHNLSSHDRVRKTPSMPTILPAKADEPSTTFLPELCPSEGRPIHTGQ